MNARPSKSPRTLCATTSPITNMRLLISFFLLLCSCNEVIRYPSGGEPFPNNLSNLDTQDYFYPYRDSLPPKMAVSAAFYDSFLYKAFNEPNLSFRPAPSPTLRLTYLEALGGAIIISVTNTDLVTKTSSPEGAIYPDIDTTLLSPLERKHFWLLERYYPFEKLLKPKYEKYYDSIIKHSPELLKPSYYKQLLKKASRLSESKNSYLSSSKPIDRGDFAELIKQLERSGFWQMQHFEYDCSESVTDGYTFILEANTPQGYKALIRFACSGDSSLFTKTCQRIVDMAGLKEKIELYNWR